MKEVNLKIEFNAYYNERKGVFDDGGIYPILEYIKNNKLKNVLVRLDVDKKNETSWEEVDLFCNDLSIKKLGYTINDKKYPKYTANVVCKPSAAKSLIKMLVQMGYLGNGGHSYGIFIGDKHFSFDGDGADHISSINDIDLNKELFSNISKQIEIYNKGLRQNDEDNINESLRLKITENDITYMVEKAIKNISKKIL